MEDAATAEISRSQIWQWVRNESKLEDGTVVDAELVRRVLDEEQARILATAEGTGHRFAEARELFEQVALADDFVDFLTLPAYDAVVAS
jgi:malate synthase